MGKSLPVITINGGSSSIKFSVCDAQEGDGAYPSKRLSGSIDKIGLPGTVLQATGLGPVAIDATNHDEASFALIDWLRERIDGSVLGVGHRVVLGGLKLQDHQVVTDKVVAELKKTEPMDLAHLPREIALIESFRSKFPDVPQIACFDTAFFKDLPRNARLLPIPRKYDDAGLRRFGFHGLSYTYLMEELRRSAGDAVADGRVILAHLGSGASMAAVKDGKPVDTTMGVTPLAGLVMGTRPGDLDPGLLLYLMRTEGLSPEQMDDMMSSRSGLLGISDTTFDVRELLEREKSDHRAAEALDMFCYQARKWIGAYAAVLGGLDTLVFAGGIGEHSPEIRGRICEGLGFLGLKPNPDAGAGARIISEGGRVQVLVIPTDEEAVIAQTVYRLVA